METFIPMAHFTHVTYLMSLPLLFGISFMQAMERPPRDGAKHSLAEEDKTQPEGKKSRSDKPLVMPEFHESVAPERQVLLRAAAEGNLEFLRQMIGTQFPWDTFLVCSEVKLNDIRYVCRDINDRDLLCFAALNRHFEVFQFLLPPCCEMLGNIIFPRSELILALRSIDERFVVQLVNRFPERYRAYRALFIAFILDCPERVKIALDVLGAQGVLGEEHLEYQPLHAAVFLNSAHGISQILARGCPIELPTYDKQTPLGCAVIDKDAGMVKILLEAGANPNSKIPKRWVIEDEFVLALAVDENLVTILELLLEHGGNPNTAHDDGGTLLHLAANLSQPDCIRALLSRAARVNVCDEDGRTPLHAILVFHQACFDGGLSEVYPQSLCCLRQLLQHGADVNARFTSGEHAGKTALSLALTVALREMEESIHEQGDGGEDDAENEIGDEHGVDGEDEVEDEIEIIKELLLWAAQIRKEDINLLRKIFQKKPLLLAVLLGEPIDEATARSAERQDRNEALQFAVARGERCIQALINYGAQVNVGLEMVDEILRRKHLTPEEREVYEAIRDTLIGCGVPSLLGSIIRRENIHDAMIQNPHFALMPRELKERLLHAILLSGMRSFNRDRISRALAAGADPAPFLYLVPELKDHPEIAELIIENARRHGMSFVEPAWLIEWRMQRGARNKFSDMV